MMSWYDEFVNTAIDGMEKCLLTISVSLTLLGEMFVHFLAGALFAICIPFWCLEVVCRRLRSK